MKIFSTLIIALMLAACAGPNRPTRSVLYDLGPPPASMTISPATTQRPMLTVSDVDFPTTLDSTSMLYRLSYSDPHQLHPFAQTRWSATPGDLVDERLRGLLSQHFMVLSPRETALLARSNNGQRPLMLRLHLEEFSQNFTAATQSEGLIRLRATLLRSTAAGEQLLAQHTFNVQRPAERADAAAGVRALTEATNATAQELLQWLKAIPLAIQDAELAKGLKR